MSSFMSLFYVVGYYAREWVLNMFPPTRTLLHTQHGTSTYLSKGQQSGTPSGKYVGWVVTSTQLDKGYKSGTPSGKYDDYGSYINLTL